MTYVVPNYFIEEHPENVISSDSLFTVAYKSKRNQDQIAVRNVMHAMILILEGTKRLTFDDRTMELQNSGIFLLSQGNYFMSEILGKRGEYEAILIYFDDNFMMEFISKYRIDLNVYKKETVVSFPSDTMLKILMDAYKLYMKESIENKNEVFKLKTEEIFLYLWSQYKDTLGSFLKSISHSSKERIGYVLESNLDLIQSVDDMCKIARVSKYELRAFIKKAYSQTPKRWLEMRHLEQAAILLKNSDKSIASIATDCGYSSLSWFGVQFKKRYGLAPKMYRKQNQ